MLIRVGILYYIVYDVYLYNIQYNIISCTYNYYNTYRMIHIPNNAHFLFFFNNAINQNLIYEILKFEIFCNNLKTVTTLLFLL